MTIEELESLAVAWTPPPGAFDVSPAGRMAARYGIPDARALAERAAADPAWYWTAGVEDLGIPWMRLYDTVVDLARGVEHPAFFPGGLLNWADCAVDRWVREGRGGARAVWWEGDDGDTLTLTYAELKTRVDAAAGALRAHGIGTGDVVALLLPMVPEAIVTVLAAAKLGAVAMPLFSGYGASAVRARLEDSGAKLLVTCDAFPRRGRPSASRRWPTRRSTTCPRSAPSWWCAASGARSPWPPGATTGGTRSAPPPGRWSGPNPCRPTPPASCSTRPAAPDARRGACTPTPACRSRWPWRHGTPWGWTRTRRCCG